MYYFNLIVILKTYFYCTDIKSVKLKDLNFIFEFYFLLFVQRRKFYKYALVFLFRVCTFEAEEIQQKKKLFFPLLMVTA